MWNDPSQPPPGLAATVDSERLLAFLAYGLFLIAPPAGGVTALIGVVIAHVRLAAATGQIYESHYRNQIRVFWTILVFAVVMMLVLTIGLSMSSFSLGLFAFAWPIWQMAALVGHLAAWTLFLPLAGLASLAMGIWYYWRLLRGFARLLGDKPY